MARGGVIEVIPQGESAALAHPASLEQSVPAAPEKLELLKQLASKGAGVSSLQYSLKMNKKVIRHLALQHGIKIDFRRPIKTPETPAGKAASDIDDTLAGHAIHYASLGHSTAEIARILGLSVREVLDIGQAYRFEFKQRPEDDPS